MDYTGRPEQAIVQLKRAMRLNPLYPEWYLWTLGDAYYSAKEYQHAITWLQKITEPEFEVHLTLTACYVALGRIQEAKIQVKEVLELEPTFSLAEYAKHLAEASPQKHPERNDEYIGALGEAGLPE